MSEVIRYTEDEFAEIDRQIKAAQAEIRRLQDARTKMVGEHWGCLPGTEVTSGGKHYLVVSIDGTFGGVSSQPWLNARKQKKDGSWSAAEQKVYRDWKLAPSIAVAEAAP